ncbi:hypothetical protein ACM46_05680 [Chryseobacterium angstadtii]|uniref:Outer membrane protein beta-barrel domain-containing protein n=1 Tax=Chryseobacterium angstadtii TaxID=558151 RepID=A0A0J7IHC1_9FLAO|nr:hypothetical protein [Chryseobacterium angstadtii]KMQ65391.1 hypothetical protein ACM46_05680 [Chryseobacterium angstadtii]
MKKMIYKTALFVLMIGMTNAQTINWGSENKEKHILNANIGAEYGVIFGLGYSYKLNSRLFPMMLGAEFSTPSGNDLLDDYKAKAGVNVRWIKVHDFQLSTRVQGLFRLIENENAAIVNFGLDMAGVIGYYRPKWFGGVEVGFDKAIVTHFKHSEKYKEIYPDVKNGWYEPATGGNFYYGLQCGYTFRNQEIYLKGGNIVSQDFKTKPLLPFYAQIGYNFKL